MKMLLYMVYASSYLYESFKVLYTQGLKYALTPRFIFPRLCTSKMFNFKSGVCKICPSGQIWPTVHFYGTHPQPFIYLLSMATLCNSKSWIVQRRLHGLIVENIYSLAHYRKTLLTLLYTTLVKSSNLQEIQLPYLQNTSIIYPLLWDLKKWNILKYLDINIS